MKRFIEFMGAVSSWMAMGALMAGLQPSLAVWQKEFFPDYSVKRGEKTIYDVNILCQ